MSFMKGILTAVLNRKGKESTSDPISKAVEEVSETVQGFNPAEQGTRRQANDMLSDSKLAKSVRPVAIIWTLALFTLALIMNWAGIKTDEQFQELIFWALLVEIGFYFPGRDLVKTFTGRAKK